MLHRNGLLPVTLRCIILVHSAVVIIIMFTEKLDDVRAYLVKNVKVDELLLSCLMANSVISTKEKSDLQRVCISSLPVLLFLSHVPGAAKKVATKFFGSLFMIGLEFQGEIFGDVMKLVKSRIR